MLQKGFFEYLLTSPVVDFHSGHLVRYVSILLKEQLNDLSIAPYANAGYSVLLKIPPSLFTSASFQVLDE